jgi:hypothetical protein
MDDVLPIVHLNNALVLNLVVAERHIAPWRCYAGYESNIDELMHPRIPRRLYLRHCYFFKSDFEILPMHCPRLESHRDHWLHPQPLEA